LADEDRLYLKFWAKLTPSEQKRPLSLIARSASAVTASEKRSINN